MVKKKAKEAAPTPVQQPKQILVSVAENETRVALMEGKCLTEIYVERFDSHSIVGNIYLGRVQNVLPGMEAAFIDIGEGRNAFLSADDVTSVSEYIEEKPSKKRGLGLKKNQAILVQVTRSPSGSKGARLTTQISLASRYMVLVPLKDFVGISHKIAGKERERLQKVASEIKPEKAGLIIRTEAQGEGKPTLIGDLTYLQGLWQRIQDDAKRSEPGHIIYREMDLAMRMMRDVLSADYKGVVVDGREKYDEITSYLSEVEPRLATLVHFYRRRDPLFKKHRIDEQIRDALKPKIWLKSGGYIIIEDTEAMTSIDVNTGRYVGRTSLEKTIVKTNLEAAAEIGRQLRLRDIGGLIVIDFINMEDAANREKVLNEFQAVLDNDRAKTEIVEISRLGLIEMTRKSFTRGLLETFTQTCPTCEGKGFVLKSAQLSS